MSYALETKKRKFHRVLESLTKPSGPESSPHRTSAVPTEQAPSKRLRLNAHDSILASVRKDALKVACPISRASSVSSQSRPSFVPWDRERFLERLETFRRVDRWSPKPTAVNEVEWAKRGWVCSDVARVTCMGGCGGSVVVKIPDELDELDGYDTEKIVEREEVRAKLVQEYANLLVQGHGENCPWRNKGCDATIHRLPLANPDTATSNLKTRYHHLVKMADQLPNIAALLVPEGFNSKDILSILPDGALQAPELQQEVTETPQSTLKSNQKDASQSPVQGDTSINETAFVLAFLGWDAVEGATNLAGCGACFRRLGLWIYKSKGDAPITDPLDVANEHMEYCPWIDRKTQSDTGSSSVKPDSLHNGWELLFQAVKVKHMRQTRAGTPSGSRAGGSEAPSPDGPIFDEPNDDAKKAKDREWWAKIRRIRQLLNVKLPKRKLSTTH
ncbi:C3HC zinc finger-like-domain-containing protein [Aspergillus crustosus]